MDPINELILNHPNLEDVGNEVRNAAQLITECFKSGGKLLLCGNGGSCADCEHIAGEMVKQFAKDRPLSPELADKLGPELSRELHGGLPALSLPSMIGFHTAFNNDDNPEFGFAQQVIAFGKPDDILLGISTSGNSKNVINALEASKKLNINSILMVGKNGNEAANLADIVISIPSEVTARIQEAHITVSHIIFEIFEEKFLNA